MNSRREKVAPDGTRQARSTGASSGARRAMGACCLALVSCRPRATRELDGRIQTKMISIVHRTQQRQNTQPAQWATTGRWRGRRSRPCSPLAAARWPPHFSTSFATSPRTLQHFSISSSLQRGVGEGAARTEQGWGSAFSSKVHGAERGAGSGRSGMILETSVAPNAVQGAAGARQLACRGAVAAAAVPPPHLTTRGGTSRTMSPLPAVMTMMPRSRAAVTSGPAICTIASGRGGRAGLDASKPLGVAARPRASGGGAAEGQAAASRAPGGCG